MRLDDVLDLSPKCPPQTRTVYSVTSGTKKNIGTNGGAACNVARCPVRGGQLCIEEDTCRVWAKHLCMRRAPVLYEEGIYV